MITQRSRSVRFMILIMAALLAAGCHSASKHRNIDIAQTYRGHIAAGRIDNARAMLCDGGASLWFEQRGSNAQPLDPAPGTGPWAAWDRHFNSRSEVIEWRAQPDAATAIVRETNDYYELLERGPQRTHLTYFIDADGRILGLLIQGGGARSRGRTDEFLAWARANAPQEIEQLMPGGNIDPRGDHPQRVRALLNRWRAETGLPPIPR